MHAILAVLRCARRGQGGAPSAATDGAPTLLALPRPAQTQYVNVIHTRKGHMRSGDIHKCEQLNHIVFGRVTLTELIGATKHSGPPPPPQGGDARSSSTLSRSPQGSARCHRRSSAATLSGFQRMCPIYIFTRCVNRRGAPLASCGIRPGLRAADAAAAMLGRATMLSPAVCCRAPAAGGYAHDRDVADPVWRALRVRGLVLPPLQARSLCVCAGMLTISDVCRCVLVLRNRIPTASTQHRFDAAASPAGIVS